jgi:hypothetical protein
MADAPIDWAAEPFEVRHRMMDHHPRPLISSVRVDPNPRHWWLHIWNRGGKAGILCVNAADGEALLARLIPPIDQVRTAQPRLQDLLDPAGRA